MKAIFLATVLGLMLLCDIAFAQTAYAVYVKNPPSARSEALCNVAPEFHINPAFATKGASHWRATGAYRSRLGLFDDEFISIAWSDAKFGAFALANVTSCADIEARQFATEQPDYYWSANRANALLGGAYAYKFLSFGAAWRHVYEKIEQKSFDANMFSLGVAAQYANFTAGVSALDLGGNQNYFDFVFSPPTVYNASLWYDSKFISGGVSAQKPNEGDALFGIAAEAKPVSWAQLRAGAKFGGEETQLSFGAGFVHKNMRLDYGISFCGQLGQNHTIGIGYGI